MKSQNRITSFNIFRCTHAQNFYVLINHEMDSCHFYAVIRRGFPLKTNLKDLDPSCKTDLDIRSSFGRHKPYKKVLDL